MCAEVCDYKIIGVAGVALCALVHLIVGLNCADTFRIDHLTFDLLVDCNSAVLVSVVAGTCVGNLPALFLCQSTGLLKVVILLADLISETAVIHRAVSCEVIGLSVDLGPAGLHDTGFLIEVVPSLAELLPSSLHGTCLLVEVVPLLVDLSPACLHLAGSCEEILLVSHLDKAGLHDAFLVKIVLVSVDLGPSGLISLLGNVIPFVVLLDPAELNRLFAGRGSLDVLGFLDRRCCMDLFLADCIAFRRIHLGCAYAYCGHRSDTECCCE